MSMKSGIPSIRQTPSAMNQPFPPSRFYGGVKRLDSPRVEDQVMQSSKNYDPLPIWKLVLSMILSNIILMIIFALVLVFAPWRQFVYDPVVDDLSNKLVTPVKTAILDAYHEIEAESKGLVTRVTDHTKGKIGEVKDSIVPHETRKKIASYF